MTWVSELFELLDLDCSEEQLQVCQSTRQVCAKGISRPLASVSKELNSWNILVPAVDLSYSSGILLHSVQYVTSVSKDRPREEYWIRCPIPGRGRTGGKVGWVQRGGSKGTKDSVLSAGCRTCQLMGRRMSRSLFCHSHPRTASLLQIFPACLSIYRKPFSPLRQYETSLAQNPAHWTLLNPGSSSWIEMSGDV